MSKAMDAFVDAADDLLATQQQLMPHPLPGELRLLTEARGDSLAERESARDLVRSAIPIGVCSV